MLLKTSFKLWPECMAFTGSDDFDGDSSRKNGCEMAQRVAATRSERLIVSCVDMVIGGSLVWPIAFPVQFRRTSL